MIGVLEGLPDNVSGVEAFGKVKGLRLDDPG